LHTLRRLRPIEVIETLAARERGSASEGERWAAHWIADRLGELGCEATVEEETVRPDTWRNLVTLNAIGAVAGLAAARGSRLLPAAAATTTLAALADDIQNGPRVGRRFTVPERTTWNVTAECGDRDAERTVVVLAHHDAAHTGAIFTQTPQKTIWEKRPERIERSNTAVPIWWPLLAAHATAALGALTGRRGLARAGGLLCALGVVTLADVWRSPVVPGANDNLTAVACLVALAERFRDDPPAGVRVLLVSAGSEETFQEGIRAWARRHFDDLPRATTSFVTIDMVGSPQLALVEGEGPIWMEDYDDGLRELVQTCADEHGISLQRKLRSRTSTDGVIPMRAGFPTVLLGSVEPWKAPTNYHWPTDTPEHVNEATLDAAIRLTDVVIRRLART
jgi:hypothetical protein